MGAGGKETVVWSTSLGGSAEGNSSGSSMVPPVCAARGAALAKELNRVRRHLAAEAEQPKDQRTDLVRTERDRDLARAVQRDRA